MLISILGPKVALHESHLLCKAAYHADFQFSVCLKQELFSQRLLKADEPPCPVMPVKDFKQGVTSYSFLFGKDNVLYKSVHVGAET